jgi:hypothetical protein
MTLMNKYSLKKEIENYRRALYVGLIFTAIGIPSMILFFLTKNSIFAILSYPLTLIGIFMTFCSIICIREKSGTSKSK